MLNRAFLAVGELYFRFFDADTGALTAFFVGFLRAFAWPLAADFAGLGRLFFADTGVAVTLLQGSGSSHPLNGDVLIIAVRVCAALVFIRSVGKAVAPGILFGKSPVPEFLRGLVAGYFAFMAGFHVDFISALTVAGIGKPDRQLSRIVFSLGYIWW